MAAKMLAFDAEARKSLLDGVTKLARAVKTTLGPVAATRSSTRGGGAPTVTKDGVTVAEEVELSDKYENIGAKLVKEAASKTSDVAGDGTTTATVLAEAIFREGYRNLTAGADAMALARGIRKAVAGGHRQPQETVQADRCQPQGRHRQRRLDQREQRSRDRHHHGRRVHEGREGRRHHRRRRQGPGDLRRCRRRHAVRPRLSLPQLHHQP